MVGCNPCGSWLASKLLGPPKLPGKPTPTREGVKRHYTAKCSLTPPIASSTLRVKLE